MGLGIELDLYISCYEFTDRGIELVTAQEMPFMNKFDLEMLGNYYSILFGNSSFEESLLFGPLPVVNYHDELVFIHGGTVKDERIRDPRIARDGFKTLFLTLVFFPVQHDHLLSRCRGYVKEVIDDWLTSNQDIVTLTREKLITLSIELVNTVLKEKRQMKLDQVPSTVQTVLIKNIEFIESIGRSLNRPLLVGVYGTNQDLFSALQNALQALFPSLQLIKRSDTNDMALYRFPHLVIETKALEKNETLDFKQMMAFTKLELDKDYHKALNGILFLAEIPMPDEVLAESLQSLLQKAPSNCPISIVIQYRTHSPVKISDTSLPEIIRNAKNRTISLLECKSGEFIASRALSDLVEKMIPLLRK